LAQRQGKKKGRTLNKKAGPNTRGKGLQEKNATDIEMYYAVKGSLGKIEQSTEKDENQQ